MAANLLQDAGSFLGPDAFGRMGEAIGESPETASRAASASLPALLGGLTEVGRHEPARVMGLIRSHHYDEDASMTRVGAMLRDRPGGALASEGSGLLQSLFGGRVDALVDGLSRTTGVNRTSTTGVLAMLAPIVLGVIGKKVHDEQLDTNGLSRLLDGQRGFVRGLVPDGIASTLGFGPASPVHRTSADAYGVVHGPREEATRLTAEAREAARHLRDRVAHTEPRDTRGHGRAPMWLWALVALAALALLFLFLFRGVFERGDRPSGELDGKPGEVTGGAVSTGAERGREAGSRVIGGIEGAAHEVGTGVEGAAHDVEGATHEVGTRVEGATHEIDTGVEGAAHDVGAGVEGAMRDVGAGIEGAARDVEGATPDGRQMVERGESGVDGFASALTSEDRPLPARFALDDLQFGVGSSTVHGDPHSIQVVASALRAFPSARIRVEGHTDSTGDASLNRELSRERADAVRAALIAHGVDGSRIDAEGYGSERPTADDATEEGRARNRRTEVALIER